MFASPNSFLTGSAAARIAIFATPSTSAYAWTVPSGITSITIEGIGAGGDGGSSASYPQGGGGAVFIWSW